MGANFSRVKNWAASETVTRTDLNAEFDNILTYFTPAGMDDYSTNATEMQTQTDPGSVGAESLATSLAGEIARLRFAIKRIAGETYWYTAPDSSISELASAVGAGLLSNRIVSGRASSSSSQPLFLVPHGTNRTVSIQGATTNLVYVVNSVQYTISSNVTSGTLTAAPSSNNTCLVNEADSADQTYTKQMGEAGTSITVDNMGSEISGLIGKLAGFSINNGSTTEYFIAKVESATELSNVVRGNFFNSADAYLPRIVYTDNDTITLMKLTWVFATTAGAIAVAYTNPRVGKDEPSSPAVGDYWYDTNNNTWKYFDSSSWVSANAILVGVCLQNTTGTIAARSADFFKNHTDLNTVELVRISNTEVRSRQLGAQLSVYGSVIKYNNDWLRWDITADRDTGVSESASTTYYCYVKESGDTVISDVAPHDRSKDLLGHYHPHETWRCVGSFFNDASSNIVAVNDFLTFNPIKYKVDDSVSSNTLIATLYDETGNAPTHTFPLTLYFRSTTQGDGTITKRLCYYSPTITVPNTATLGHQNSIATYVHIYALDNVGRVELAISTMYHTGSASLITTSAVDTSADSATAYYSTTARTSVAGIILARFQSNQATAGTWATAMSSVDTWPWQRKFGTWVSKAESTVYQALSDGFLIGHIASAANESGIRTVNGLTDSSNPPTTHMGNAYLFGHTAAYYHNGERASFLLPVKAGEYYKTDATLVTGTATSTRTFYWVPLE